MDYRVVKLKKEKFSLLNIIDPHFADEPPGSRVGDFLGDIIDKFKQVGKLVIKHKIDVVNICGDMFKNKVAEKNSHRMVGEILNVVKDWDCIITIIIGNHDIIHDRIDLWEQQPITVLVKSGLFHLLDGHPIKFITKDDKNIVLRGCSYRPDTHVEETEKPDPESDLLIHTLHYATAPKAGIYPRYKERIYSYNELHEFAPDVFLLGHIHTDHGITEMEGKWFFQHGSLSRTSTHDYNADRDIKVGLLEVGENLKVEASEIKLDVKPFLETFSLEKKKRIEKETKELKGFVDTLSMTTEDRIAKGSTLKIVDLIKSVEKLDVERLLKLFSYYKDRCDGKDL